MKKAYIYSIGEFNGLSEEFKKDKAIIRIHDISNKDFYPKEEDGALVLFFNDVVPRKGCINKLLYEIGFHEPIHEMSKEQAIKLLGFIYENRNKEFIIHCVYGRSRSVAVGVFLEEAYNFLIDNKSVKERAHANKHVVKLLHKFDMKR